MAQIAGMKPTGREFLGTSSKLLELEDDDGLRHLAIQYKEEYRGHKSISLAVELAASFLEYPMVAGLVELSHFDLEKGLFVYPTGDTWILSEILRKYRDIGQPLGVRAALELLYLGGRVLSEAAENGSLLGVYAHGDLSPDRILLTPQGLVQIIGYGLPQVEMQVRQESPDHPIDVRSLHYCPPERYEGNLEDVDADLYGLVLICVAMITGKPLYDGPVDKVKEQVRLSEAGQLVSRIKDIPPETLAMFRRALIYDPDRRFGKPETWLEEVKALLDSEAKSGASLIDVMARLGSAGGAGRTSANRGGPPARKAVVASSTTAFTPGQLAQMADEDEDDELETKVETRWGKAGGRKSAEAAPAAPAAEGRATRRGEAPAADPARPLRRGAAPEAEAEPARPLRRGAAPDADAEPARPLRRGAAAEGEAEAARPLRRAAEGDAEAARPLRRGAEPEGEAARPLRRGAEPEGEAARPLRRGAEPEGEAARPLRRAAEPEGEAARPLRRGAEPEGEAARPLRRGAEPEGEAARPLRRGAEPEGEAARPLRRGAEPEGEAARPLRRGTEPEGEAARPLRRGGEGEGPRRIQSEEPAPAAPADPPRVEVEAALAPPAAPAPSPAPEGSAALPVTEGAPAAEPESPRRMRGDGEGPRRARTEEGEAPRRARSEEPEAAPRRVSRGDDGETPRRATRAEEPEAAPRRAIRGEEGEGPRRARTEEPEGDRPRRRIRDES